jgi:hypothetical protein
MDDTIFEALLNAYGSDLSRWPADLREDARAWRAASPRAQSRQREAAQLDALIDAVTADVSEFRAQRVVNHVLQATSSRKQKHSAPRGRWPLWLSAALFAAAATAGCTTGLHKPEWIGLNTVPPTHNIVEAALGFDAMF